MKKILIGVAALALLGGGGAGVFFMMKKPAEAALPAADAEHAKAEAKDDHKDAKEHAPIFVRMDPLVVPVLDADGASQVISMIISIEAADEEAAKKIDELRPRIKDAYIQSLYGLINSTAAMERGVLRVPYVKQRLHSVTQKVMGEGVVKDVLLQMVQQNPI